jgi:hypothetical protein
MPAFVLRTFAVLILAGLASVLPARAADDYDACAGFIDSVPATITSQGVWCLRKDLSTAIASGSAITIATNNVTIDCNGFKLGGLAAGPVSLAWGIYASERRNVAVRGCNIRGFHYGILIFGGAGHLVEDNRIDRSLFTGIHLHGDNSRVLRNAVYNTGGALGYREARGIDASAEVAENAVSGLFADLDAGVLFGIGASGAGTSVRDNSVTGFTMDAVQGGQASYAYGIKLDAPGIRASGNHVDSGASAVPGTGLYTEDDIPGYCLHNTVGGFAEPIDADCAGSDNLFLP